MKIKSTGFVNLITAAVLAVFLFSFFLLVDLPLSDQAKLNLIVCIFIIILDWLFVLLRIAASDDDGIIASLGILIWISGVYTTLALLAMFLLFLFEIAIKVQIVVHTVLALIVVIGYIIARKSVMHLSTVRKHYTYVGDMDNAKTLFQDTLMELNKRDDTEYYHAFSSLYDDYSYTAPSPDPRAKNIDKEIVSILEKIKWEEGSKDKLLMQLTNAVQNRKQIR